VHGNSLGFSGHGCPLKIHHRLLGNPGNNTARPCRVARQAVLGKSCSIFRTRNALRFYHTEHTTPVRAWEPPEKLYLRTIHPARRLGALMHQLNSCTTGRLRCFFDPPKGAC
jgi:hypothetical protein